MIYPRVMYAEVTQADARCVRMRYVLAVGILAFDLTSTSIPTRAAVVSNGGWPRTALAASSGRAPAIGRWMLPRAAAS